MDIERTSRISAALGITAIGAVLTAIGIHKESLGGVIAGSGLGLVGLFIFCIPEIHAAIKKRQRGP